MRLLAQTSSVAQLGGRKPARGERSLRPVVFAKLRQASAKIPAAVRSNPFRLSLRSSSWSTRSSNRLRCGCVELGKPSVAGNADAPPSPRRALGAAQRAGVPFGLTALCKTCGASAAWRCSPLSPELPLFSDFADLYLVSSWSLNSKIPGASETELGSAFT